MTKDELRTQLQAGKTLDDLFTFRLGQECLIFKEHLFPENPKARDEIIYIPDLSLNDLHPDKPCADEECIRLAVATRPAIFWKRSTAANSGRRRSSILSIGSIRVLPSEKAGFSMTKKRSEIERRGLPTPAAQQNICYSKPE